MRILTFRARKHKLRHEKPFKCVEIDCERSKDGFSTQADLSRHQRTVHDVAMAGTSEYQCKAEGCPKKDKIWYRADNFREHCRRLHPSLNFSELMENSLLSKKVDVSSAVPDEPLEDAITSQRLPTSASSAMIGSLSVAKDSTIIEVPDNELQRLRQTESSVERARQVEKIESPIRDASISGVNDSTKKRGRTRMKCSECRLRKIKVSDQS